MTALTLSTAAASGLRADAIVVGVAKGSGSKRALVVAPGAESVDKAYDGKLASVLETLGASGGEGEVTKLPAPAASRPRSSSRSASARSRRRTRPTARTRCAGPRVSPRAP